MLYFSNERTVSMDDVASLGSFPDITLNADVIFLSCLDNIPIVSNDDA